MAEYTINELYKQAFGEDANPYRVDTERVDPAPVTEGEPRRDDWLGRNIQMPFNLGTFSFPDEPLIQLSFRRQVVSKNVAGGRGSVVDEIINDGYYQLRIRGIFVNDNDVYPIEDMLTLRAILSIRGAIPVTNLICRVMGIRQIIIIGANFPDMPDIAGAQAFEILAKQTTDVELELIEQLEQKTTLQRVLNVI